MPEQTSRSSTNSFESRRSWERRQDSQARGLSADKEQSTARTEASAAMLFEAAFHRADSRPEKDSSPLVPCECPRSAVLRNRHSPTPPGPVRFPQPHRTRATRRFAARGQQNVRATGVPAGDCPLGFAVSDEVKAPGHGFACCHAHVLSIAAVYSPRRAAWLHLAR